VYRAGGSDGPLAARVCLGSTRPATLRDSQHACFKSLCCPINQIRVCDDISGSLGQWNVSYANHEMLTKSVEVGLPGMPPSRRPRPHPLCSGICVWIFTRRAATPWT
jgi:hypothetical protein